MYHYGGVLNVGTIVKWQNVLNKLKYTCIFVFHLLKIQIFQHSSFYRIVPTIGCQNVLDTLTKITLMKRYTDTLRIYVEADTITHNIRV